MEIFYTIDGGVNFYLMFLCSPSDFLILKQKQWVWQKQDKISLAFCYS
jgi:hypothetical protein